MRRTPVVLLCGLLAMWLLLNGTLAPGHFVFGAVIAMLMTAGFRSMRPLQPKLRRPQAVIVLLLRVLVDIVRSNIGVARIVLGLVGDRQVRSGFLQVPLDLRDPHGLAALATIVTSTPGTVWVELSQDDHRLTLHVLDLQDEDTWVRAIKQRYERPLREIFE